MLDAVRGRAEIELGVAEARVCGRDGGCQRIVTVATLALVADGFWLRHLGSFNLIGVDRFLADVHGDEEIRIRQRLGDAV